MEGSFWSCYDYLVFRAVVSCKTAMGVVSITCHECLRLWEDILGSGGWAETGCEERKGRRGRRSSSWESKQGGGPSISCVSHVGIFTCILQKQLPVVNKSLYPNVIM